MVNDVNGTGTVATFQKTGFTRLAETLKLVPPPSMDQWLRYPYATAILGRNEYDLGPTRIILEQKPHFVISGAPASGKTTALMTFMISLASRYTSEQVAMVLIDHQGNLGDYGSSRDYQLAQLPHVLGKQVISEKDQLDELILHLKYEYQYAPSQRASARELFIFIDNYDDIEQLDPSVSGGNPFRKAMGYMARRYGRQSRLHFVIAGMREAFTGDDLMRPVGSGHHGLAMDTDAAEGSPFYANVPRTYRNTVLPRGRGFIVMPGSVSVTQVAMYYYDEESKTDELDDWFLKIMQRDAGKSAEWLPISDESKEAMKKEPARAGVFQGYVETHQTLPDYQYKALLVALGKAMGGKTPAEVEEGFGSTLKTEGGHQALINTAMNLGVDVEAVLRDSADKDKEENQS